MEIKDILETLKTDLLTEEQQKEVEQKLQDIVDLHVQEKLTEAIEQEKESLIEVYEQKYEEYKNETISKFSDFVDTILEDEMKIPENIVEYARLGELYSDLITEFKSRIAIDEGTLDEEAKELLAEAKDEIQRLRDEINEVTKDLLESKNDAKEFAAELYKRKKCDGLTEAQRGHVLRLLEGINTQKDIDRKFEVIKSHYLNEKGDDEGDDKTTDCTCPDCKKSFTVKGAVDENTKCENCGTQLKENVSEGRAEVDDKKKVEVVEDSPFAEYKKNVLRVLTEKRF